MIGSPYVPNGRYLAVELPDGSVETDTLTGEMILQPSAIKLLDQLRVLFCPLPASTTGNRLRIMREALGLTRQELAEQMDAEESVLADLESGKRCPTPEQLAALEQVRQRAVRSFAAGTKVGFVMAERS
jgi:DNA-binding transcriptional regulator YiaG